MADDRYVPNLNGFYLGKVLTHEKNGRCKIWIPGIHPDEYKEKSKAKEIPDAVQVSTIFGGGREGSGTFSYPNIDSIVVCFFINGDQNFPAYLGMLVDGPEAKTKWEQIYPESATTGDISEGSKSHTHLINSGKANIWLNEDGEIKLETWSSDLVNKSSIYMNKDGKIIIEATNQIDIKSPKIKIDAQEKIDITTPDFVNRNAKKNSVISPTIELNATGGVIIKRTWWRPSGYFS